MAHPIPNSAVFRERAGRRRRHAGASARASRASSQWRASAAAASSRSSSSATSPPLLLLPPRTLSDPPSPTTPNVLSLHWTTPAASRRRTEVVFRGVTPEVVFRDFRARQKGILKAFTTEVDRFYLKCDTDEEILCLYGFPDETWEVHLPVEEVPPDLPEPTIGINFARDARDDKCWLSRVAAYSDSWLLSLAFFYAARFDFYQESRKRLFSMINSVPTIFEVVKGTDKKQPLRDPPYPARSRSRRPPPEFVFRDFRARQQGLLKALTTELDRFYLMCDQEKETLCLYGLPNETWEVNLPAEEVPPELPEPALGINFARDGMNDKDWLSLVAAHSDSWLLSVAFYFGARFGFDQDSRKRLFSMINSVPTIFEVVTGTDKRRPKEKTPKSDSKSIKSASKPTRQLEPIRRSSKIPLSEDNEASDGDEEKEQEDHESTLCGACGENYGQEEFWICCDLCEKWFHGKCVKITPAKAEHIKQYKCPNCSSSSKRARA